MSELTIPENMDEMLYLRHIIQQERTNTPGLRTINAKFPRIGPSDSPGSSVEIVEVSTRLVLRGTKELSSEDGRVRMAARVRPIRRVEIFCNEHVTTSQYDQRDRGLVLFDDRNMPIVHILDALIGYQASGPSLTWMILDSLGVPEWMFSEIQRKFWDVRSTNTPYYIIVQNAPRSDSASEWRWTNLEPPSGRDRLEAR